MEVEQAAVTEKEAVGPLSTRGSGGMLPQKILKFKISSILGIKKSVVYDNFCLPMNTVFEEANVLDSLLIYF